MDPFVNDFITTKSIDIIIFLNENDVYNANKLFHTSKVVIAIVTTSLAEKPLLIAFMA